MLNYIYGKVVWRGNKCIIFEHNYKGFKINVKENANFELDKYLKIYILKVSKVDHKNNYIEELYGFNTSMERNLFNDLLSIPGIGQVIAMNIINNDIEILNEMICTKDIEGLTNFKSISPKIANLIVATLYDKYERNYKNKKTNTNCNSDLVFALQKLGYSKEDIKIAIDNSFKNPEPDLSNLISNSIKCIVKYHE